MTKAEHPGSRTELEATQAPWPPIDISAITLPSPMGAPLLFADYRTAHAILLLSNQRTSAVVRAIVRQLQADPRTADVPILQVAHLVGVPRAVRRMAEREIRSMLISQYAELSRDRGMAVEDARRLLALGLDWEGQVTKQFGFTSTDAQPVTAILDEHSSVVTLTRDPNPIAELSALLGSMTAANPVRSTP
jgi:hypothetical protein